MGRLIVRALEAGAHDVRIASRFRAWRSHGNEELQRALRKEALAEADRIAESWLLNGYKPDVFLTYHLYHKAPDWIGPALATRFAIPYAVIEASRAPKRQTGPWAFGFAAADAALQRADQVAALHRADRECLSEVVPKDRLQVLLPFLDCQPFQIASRTAQNDSIAHDKPLKLLTVGMMRPGDKQRSYEVLSKALQALSGLPWHLTIIGDGPARDEILPLFPAERITCLGALAPEALPEHYAAHDLFVWPAIREAFGLVFLEAQASGLGVVAGDTFGVPDIVADKVSGLISPEGDAAAFAANLEKVLTTPGLAEDLGRAAKAHVADKHCLDAGTRRLNAFLETALDQYWHRMPSMGRLAPRDLS